jgi:hypothetical protein
MDAATSEGPGVTGRLLAAGGQPLSEADVENPAPAPTLG